MFPQVSDFNFMMAGIATFAATVGYACSRRLSTSLSNADADLIRESVANEAKLRESTSESNSAIEAEAMSNSSDAFTAPKIPDSNTAIATVSRKQSLKRKVPHDGFDEPEKEELGYPHNLANLYPNKRSRTPSAESEASSPGTSPTASFDSITSVTPHADVEIPFIPNVPQSVVMTPAPEPPRTPSPAPEVASPREPSPDPCPPEALAAPALELAPRPTNPPPTIPRDITPQPTTPKPFSSPASTGFAAFANRDALSRPLTPKAFMSPSSGFAAFAGSTSPFASLAKPSQSTLGKTAQRSIWSTSDLTTHQNETEAADIFLGDAFKPSENNHAIEEAKVTSSHPLEKHTHVTGEEDEDVELEQKGVKLFVKRGSGSFAEGIFGHMKLLTNRKTQEQRILFRREPLWKVSMNVRVQPTVRATYVPEENVLRFILKEAVDQSSLSTESTSAIDAKQQVVIYALKPGRSCSKQDFQDFAEGLLKSPNFKNPSAKTRSA